MHLKSLFFLFPIVCSFSYKSYEPNRTLDTHMSAQEKKEAGVHKLSPQEKKALQEWINKNHYVRPGAKKQTKKYPEVSEVIGNGAYVKLSDGSIWQIHPADRLLTQSWISAAEITVEKTGNATYGYILKNNLTGSDVRAEKVAKIPSYFRNNRRKQNTNTAPIENRQQNSTEENAIPSTTEKRSKTPPKNRPGFP